MRSLSICPLSLGPIWLTLSLLDFSNLTTFTCTPGEGLAPSWVRDSHRLMLPSAYIDAVQGGRGIRVNSRGSNQRRHAP